MFLQRSECLHCKRYNLMQDKPTIEQLRHWVNTDLNFCRVFELPSTYPRGFCFGGGYPVTMYIVDWFNPLHDDLFGPSGVKSYAEYEKRLYNFVALKNYVQHGREYLVLLSFGQTLLVTKEGNAE